MSKDTTIARAGLTQQQAADLGITRMGVTQAETGRRQGATVGALQYLIASWSEMDGAARERVRARLAAMRADIG